MTQKPLITLILAAGEGTRMKSTKPKVMHEIASQPMLGHVLRAAIEAGSQEIGVVVGPQHAVVQEFVKKISPQAKLFTQVERNGTAHAVLQAEEMLASRDAHLIVAFGDTPLLQAETLKAVQEELQQGASVTIGAFETVTPKGYGRLISKDDDIVAIREEKDATPDEKKITLVNGGLMGLDLRHALSLLKKISNQNAAKEFYLTDIVALAHDAKLKVTSAKIPADDVLGVNTKAQLADAEHVVQQRLRAEALEAGVTLINPQTVTLAADTIFGQDVTIAPYVVFGSGVKIEDDVQILSFTSLAGANIKKGARVGPFARIRPGSEIGEGAHVGNFVEINRTLLAPQVEANHLAYLGDAKIGQGTNIGAGTITCNFDGADKFKTHIGKDVFVGSNSTLVAPLSIGDETLVAAGSTITKDVPEGCMVFGRVKEQMQIVGKGRERIRLNKEKRVARKAREKKE